MNPLIDGSKDDGATPGHERPKSSNCQSVDCETTSELIQAHNDCLLLEVPISVLTQCSDLFEDHVVKLKGTPRDTEVNCPGSLEISVAKKDAAILVALKAVDSSLQALAGTWRYAISCVSIESCKEETNSKFCPEVDRLSSNDGGNNDGSRDNNSEIRWKQLQEMQGSGADWLDEGNISMSSKTVDQSDTTLQTVDQSDTTLQTVDQSDTTLQTVDHDLSDETTSLIKSESTILEAESAAVDALSMKLTRRRGHRRKVSQCSGITEQTTKEEAEGSEVDKPLESLGHSCSCCGRVFRLLTMQRRHEAKCLVKRHDFDFLSCRRCREDFSCFSDYADHLDQCKMMDSAAGVHGKDGCVKMPTNRADQTICDVCFVTFRSRSRMLRHKYRVHLGEVHDGEEKKAGRYYPCKFCDQVFTNGSSRHRHQKFYCTDNPDCKRPHCCNQCGNFFTCEEELLSHKQRRHKNALAYICHLCGTELSSRSSIYFHNLKRHSGKPPKFKCSHCEKAFYTRNKLEKHLTSHSNDRNIQCELCGKQFKTPQHVVQHKKTIHENRYRYRCEKCGHGMEKLQYLQSHKCGRVRRIQENEKTMSSVSVEEVETVQKQTMQSTLAVPPDGVGDAVQVVTTQLLFPVQDNQLNSNYILPDINLMNSYQPSGEPGVDPVTPSLAVPVSVTDHPYILSPSTPTYTQFMTQDNIRY